MSDKYNVGTSNLPKYIRIILSQTPGVRLAADTHDRLYANPSYIDENGKKKRYSRKQVDQIFRDEIEEFTGDAILADAYHKGIKKLGFYGWYRARFKEFYNEIKDYIKVLKKYL